MKSFAFGPTGSKINTQPDSQPKKKKKKPSKITTPKLLLFFVEKMIIITLSYLTETTHPTNPQDFIKSWHSGKSANVKVVRGLKGGEMYAKYPQNPQNPHFLSMF